ncbi:MAG: HAD family hydrolase [Clostridia bacterium]
MSNEKLNNCDTIFVDCFSTIIFRNTKRKDVFKQWAQKLSRIYKIDWKKFYKSYKKINFKLCFKKLFTSFTLQEKFEVVLKALFTELVKEDNQLNLQEFIDTATDFYIQTEMDCFRVNQHMIDFLEEEKKKAKKIYLVSDFYCGSDIITKWFTNFKIEHIFDNIFSSSDFDKEKATTKLYKQLIKQLKLNPKNVIMYGDNLWSDVFMARACGLQAKRIK